MADNHTLPHQLKSLPTCDEFHPKDHGEATRYLIVRDAVLTHMQKEPAVKVLFARWDKKTKLSKLATTVATAKDRGRDVATQRLIEAIRSLARTIGPEIIQATETWGLPWPWVDRGLLRAFVLQHSGTATGTPFRTWSELQKDELDITLKLRSGTSQQEVNAAMDRIQRAYETNLLPPGRAPKQPKLNEVSHLDRNSSWFVRYQIGGESISKLAKQFHDTYHQTPDGPLNCQNDESTVSKGIKEVERLLRLTTYIRRPESAGK
jgi:hypothetical protein